MAWTKQKAQQILEIYQGSVGHQMTQDQLLQLMRLSADAVCNEMQMQLDVFERTVHDEDAETHIWISKIKSFITSTNNGQNKIPPYFSY